MGFRNSGSITRQEAAVLIARAFHIEEQSGDTSFSDDNAIASWAKGHVKALTSLKVIQGKNNGIFEPNAELSRAEAATILSNLIADVVNEDIVNSTIINGSLVVNTPNVEIKNITINGNLYITQGVGEGDVTLDGVVVNGTVFVEGGGDNTVIFNNVTVQGALVVNKFNDTIRILATGNTKVSVATLASGAVLVTKELLGGGFETVEIPVELSENSKIVLDGIFNRVVNASETAHITANGTIKEFVAEANTTISGDVKVDRVIANEQAIIKVNDQIVESGNSLPGKNEQPGQIGGDSGGTPGTGGGGAINVKVTEVILPITRVSMTIGTTYQLEVELKPANATNKSVKWEVLTGPENGITVTDTGLLTANAIGTYTIKVTTVDGNYSAEATVVVSKPVLEFAVSKYKEKLNEDANLFDKVIAGNSDKLTISEVAKSTTFKNAYEVTIKASEPLESIEPSEEEVDKGSTARIIANVTVSLSGAKELAEIKDELDMMVEYFAGGMYQYYPKFGVSGTGTEFSFPLTLELGSEERAQTIALGIVHDNIEHSVLLIHYIPAGTAYVESVGPIKGGNKVGNTLEIGLESIKFVGDVNQDQIKYQWYRANEIDGPYLQIEGANASAYEVTEKDQGAHIKVSATYAGLTIYSPVLSIAPLIQATEVYRALDNVILGENTSSKMIAKNLVLPQSLENFEDVKINWISSNENVVSNSGIVTRQQEDQEVTITATLSGNVVGELTKEYTLTILSETVNEVITSEFIDPYFASDYPQVTIKNNQYWVKIKLNKPAEVYMTVNTLNNYWESDVNAVLEGRAGTGEIQNIRVDSWPYVKVTDSEQIYELPTGAYVYGNYENKSDLIRFVVKDEKEDYVSPQVTVITVDRAVIDAVDTIPPYFQEAFINNEKNSIFIYFNERLNDQSVPKPEEFSLNVGTVNHTSIVNAKGSIMASYVKLEVSGLAKEFMEELRVSYSGDSLTDTADARNKVRAFETQVTSINHSELQEVILSADRSTVIVTLPPHEGKDFDWNSNYFKDNISFIVDGRAVSDTTVQLRTTWNSSTYTRYFFQLTKPLPVGDTEITINTKGLFNYAFDQFPESIKISDFKQLNAPIKPTVSYVKGEAWQNGGSIKLTFNEGVAFTIQDAGFSYIAAGFTLKIGEQEIKLRGGIVGIVFGKDNENKLEIKLYGNFEKHIDQAIQEAIINNQTIELKYEREFISDITGSKVPNFDYLPITIE